MPLGNLHRNSLAHLSHRCSQQAGCNETEMRCIPHPHSGDFGCWDNLKPKEALSDCSELLPVSRLVFLEKMIVIHLLKKCSFLMESEGSLLLQFFSPSCMLHSLPISSVEFFFNHHYLHKVTSKCGHVSYNLHTCCISNIRRTCFSSCLFFTKLLGRFVVYFG